MILEFILGVIIFLVLLNIFFAFIPIPRGILGTILAILIIILTWRLVF